MIPEDQTTLDLRERESIFYSPPRSTTWYLALTHHFLDNFGLGFSTPRTPFPTGGIHTPVNMSSSSSVFSQSPEVFIHGGPSVPQGYQSLSGTFAGASPQPIDQRLLTGNSGNLPLGVGDIYMMSGSVPVSQPQGGQFPPGGQPQLTPGGQPQGTPTGSGGQPQGQYTTPCLQYCTPKSTSSININLKDGNLSRNGNLKGMATPRVWQPQGYQPQEYQPQGYQPQGQGQPQYSVFTSRLSTPRVNTLVKVINHLKGHHMVKVWELHLTVINPILNTGHGPQYPQPVTSQYPGLLTWDPSQGQQMLQPSIQSAPQAGQPVVPGPPQQPQPVQSSVQTPVTSVVTQAPIAPGTPPHTAAATTATSTMLTSGVSAAPVSTVPVTTPQTSVPLSGSTVQTTVQMPVGPPYKYGCYYSTSICSTSVPGTVSTCASCPTTGLPVSTVSWVHLSTTSATPVRSG